MNLYFILLNYIGIHLIICSLKVEGCNEAVCASVVSKCMLIKSCKCDIKDCSCCLECSQCLGKLYTECCSCVDLCPAYNDTNEMDLSAKSHVEEFSQNFPELFRALTKDPDPDERWISYTYEAVLKPKTIESETDPIQDITVYTNEFTFNCTVAYFSVCMSFSTCKRNCQALGSSSYRWFHDGCCECIGDTCINYGLNESRCKNCPDPTDFIPEESILDDEDLDYG